MYVVELIDDLRTDRRAEPFWRKVATLVHSARWILDQKWQPSDCARDVPLDRVELKQLYEWLNRFQYTERRLTHDDVLVREATWGPQDGSHRASSAYALNLDVPASLVRVVKEDLELYFDGIWKWR